MKKLLYSLFSLALVLTSCATWDDPTTENYGDGPVLKATLGLATDSAVTFKLTPSSNAVYYSYALYQGTEATVDATTLLKNTGGGLATGIYNYKQDTTATVTLSGLMPNTNYVVYAVASTKDGVLGEVTSFTFKTTDALIPGLSSAVKTNLGGIAVIFKEAITRGAGKVTCTIYKEWDIANTKTVNANVTISGDSAIFSIPDTIPGAYLAYNWEQGAFLDAVGNKCAAYTRSGLGDDGTFVGLVNHVDNVSFALSTEGITPVLDTLIIDWKSFNVKLNLQQTCYLNKTDLKGKEIKVTYTNSVSSTTYNLTYGTTWSLSDGESGKLLSIKLPAAPKGGDKVTITLAEGFIYDVYGNSNKALTITDAYTMNKDITRDDLVGSYTFSYVSNWAENGEATTMSISLAADPDNENGIILKDMLRAGTTVKGVYDQTAKTLTFEDWQVITTSVKDGVTRYYMFTINGGSAIVFTVNADGTLVAKSSTSTTGTPWGIYVMANDPNSSAEADALGWYDLAKGDATMTPATAASAQPYKAINARIANKNLMKSPAKR